MHLESTAVLQSYSVTAIRFAEDQIEALDLRSLPKNWRRYPTIPENQAICDLWVAEARSLVLRVPSAVIPSSANFLLNPLHPAFPSVTIDRPERFAFDPRLLKA